MHEKRVEFCRINPNHVENFLISSIYIKRYFCFVFQRWNNINMFIWTWLWDAPVAPITHVRIGIIRYSCMCVATNQVHFAEKKSEDGLHHLEGTFALKVFRRNFCVYFRNTGSLKSLLDIALLSLCCINGYCVIFISFFFSLFIVLTCFSMFSLGFYLHGIYNICVIPRRSRCNNFWTLFFSSGESGVG